MKLVLLLCALLAAAAAESIRETETMDPNGMFVDELIESSGSLPDDEDLDDPDYYGEMDPDSDSDDDEEDDDEGSGSGVSDEMDDLESTVNTPTTELSNDIQEEDDYKHKDEKVVVQGDNDILVKKLIPDETEPSNEISMASTANDIFSKTEVIVALVAGAVVGLLFAVFIITLLVVRYRRNKGDVSYDAVKKPIYKKAPTVEA